MGSGEIDQGRLLETLQCLLEIQAVEVKVALRAASDLLVRALDADKVDVFLYDASISTLVAVGTSTTPLSERQRSLGLDRLQVANGGRTVQCFEQGLSYCSGHVDEDLEVLRGVREALGVRSMILVPMNVAGERRGVLGVSSVQPEHYSNEDLRFLEAVAQWIGVITHRAELVEHIAQEMAERAKRMAAEELVTVLAHDINNYMAPLAGRLELMASRARREGRSRDLQDAEKARMALRRLSSLIEDLLDTARLDQGIFSLSLRPVNVAALVRETVEVLHTPEMQIVMEVPDDLYAEIDPARVRQLLENLLSNALRHSPPGGNISVSLRSKECDGSWIVITIRDEGPGIPPELLPRVFQRFTAGRGSPGLGLGLYIAHGIAQAHGGTLEVASALGAGTTFRLSLPAEPGATASR